MPPDRFHVPWKGCFAFAVTAMLMCAASGCASFASGDYFTPPWKRTGTANKKDDLPKDSITLTSRGLERETVNPEIRAEMDTAHRLYQENKYAEAEKAFHKLANPDKSSWLDIGSLFDSESSSTTGSASKKQYPKSIYEEALYYEAECQRLQRNYRDGVNTYTKLLTNFPRTQYTPGACKGLFEIAHYWLEPTRAQMKEYEEQLKGDRWFVTPAMYVHFSKDMPALDAEGHALLILNTIRLHDINGPLGEKALLYLGTVNFYRKDYKEADYSFKELFEKYPNSKHAATALKQSVICKQLITGGSVYDCRGVEESKKLLMTGQGAYQELAQDKEWVETQLKSINVQQADRDYKIAEFYRRTGHPGSAYFYYELVRRRYPGGTYAKNATIKMNEIRGEVEREQGKQAAANGTPQTPAPQTPPARVDPLFPPTPNVVPPPRELAPGSER